MCLVSAICVCILYAPIFVTSFNVDIENYVKYHGDRGSMFGFSVAEHKESGISRVLVGAPEANTTQPGVYEGGAVYSCLPEYGSCTMIVFDRFGDYMEEDGSQVDIKSNQWFGATVQSSGEDGVVMACAPRYIWTTPNKQRRDPVGTCYVAKNNFSHISEYSPCRTHDWGYHKQGSCQAGLGASVSKDGRRLFVGAVGSWYWQGQLHSIDEAARLPFLPPRRIIQSPKGQIISQNLHKRPDVLSTGESPLVTEDYSYLGYSVASGNFSGKPGHGDVAVGMPRGAGLLGKVVLYTWNTTNIQNFTGEQLGAYFGYSLCVNDINGDGTDDLVIGAPMYTDLSNNLGHYETGRIYIVYLNHGKTKFDSLETRDGKNSRGRFGLALTSLGDINRDGYGDFAVGAPYDGEEGRGVVYIFHGSVRGVRKEPSQVIMGKNIEGRPSTFGFSLAGGMDLDGNEYPDLVVGAYESDAAVYLRARPVVKITASATFLEESKQIDLEKTDCTLKSSGKKVPCLGLQACLSYGGLGVDEELFFNVSIVLDAKKTDRPRMFFLSDERRNIMNETLRLKKGSSQCNKMFVYIKPNIRDKLTAIDAELRYQLVESKGRRTRRSLAPILDLNEELSRKDTVIIQKNCGKDNICIPNLELTVTPSVSRYLLGSGEKLNLTVLVHNEGEDAFEAIFELQLPPGLNYVKIERLDDAEKEIPVLCSAPALLNNYTLRCDIGNPLPREKLVRFKVLLQPYHQDGMNPRYEFLMVVNSTNPENATTVDNNRKLLIVPIWVETDIILHGLSQPADVHYNISLYKDENVTHEGQIGPQVSHVYSIRNKGPSDIVEAEAVFLWPSYTLAGDHLLYLLEQPKTSGNMKCELVEEVNIENLLLEKRKYYLDYQDKQEGSSAFGSSSSSSSSSGTRVAEEETHFSSSSFSSSSSSSHSSSSSSSGSLEETLRKREEEDAATDLSGDGSERHRKRLQGGGIETTHYSSNGGKLESHSHSKPNYETRIYERGRVETSRGGVIPSSRGQEDRHFQTSRNEWSSGVGGRQGPDREFQRGNVEGSFGRGQNQSYFEERRNSSNTTWSSGSPSITHTSTSWVIGEDGIVRNGSLSSTSTGTRNLNREEFERERGRSGSRVYSEERYNQRNTSWGSADGGKPRVSETSNQRINKDDVASSSGFTSGQTLHISGNRDNYGVSSHGSAVDSFGKPIDVNERSYFEDKHHRESETSRIPGRIYIPEDRSHVVHSTAHHSEHGGRGQYGGERRDFEDGVANGRNRNKSFSEERYHERNSSWTSGDGRPIVSEHSSWKISEDGRVRNGSRSNVHVEDRSGTLDSHIQGINKHLEDQDLRGQLDKETKVFSEEHEKSFNTTWSSAHGGQPVTHYSGSWSINEGGRVRNGSSSNVYEGTPPPFDRSQLNTNRRTESHFDERTRSGTERGADISGRVAHSSTHTLGSQRGEERTRHSGGGSHATSHSEDHSTGQATNINFGDLIGGSRSQASDFQSLGAVAVGPRDGVARTYTFDVETDSDRGSGRSSGSRHYSSGGSIEGARHSGRHYGSVNQDLSVSEEYGGAETRHSVRGGSGGFSATHNTEELGSDGHSVRGGSGGFSATHNTEELGLDGHSVRSGSGGFSTTHNTGAQDLGGHSSSSSHHSSSRTWSSGGHSSGVLAEDTVNDRDRGYQRGHSKSWSYSSTSGTADGDNVGIGGSYGRRGHPSEYTRHESHDDQDQRYKREIDTKTDDLDSLSCGPTKCIRIRCTVGPLAKDEEAFVEFKSRIWLKTIKRLANSQKLFLSSMVGARVSSLPHIGPPDVSLVHTHEVQTEVIPRETTSRPDVIPLWVVVLSACAGAVILMLLVYILYKVGFFKRSRPSDSPEKEPLNRNGYQNGDEAL